MARRNIEEDIGNLSRLRDSPVTDATLTALRKGLRDRVNLVAAKAAQVVGDLQLKPLTPDLIAAFDRCFVHPADSDPQCWAKNAIAKALTDLDHDESEPFLRGYRYTQLEGSWGGPADTAVTLRSLCTLALVQCADLPRAEKLRHLVLSATDREETVRVDALRALEQLDGEEAALLLRLKAATGDPRASVVGQALESLLRIEGPRALDFAASFLRVREPDHARELSSTVEEVVEEAALALGASRLPAAVDALKQAWAADPKIVFLQAISASRQQAGFEFLLTLVRSGRERDAAAALEALSLHRESAEVRASVGAAVESAGTVELRHRFHARFR
jgi:hypothetical protein